MKRFILILAVLVTTLSTFADEANPKTIELTDNERQLVENNNRFAFNPTIPAVLVRKRGTIYIGESIDYIKAVRKVFAAGYITAAVFDLDDSLTEENWTYLKDEGDIIPCSFSGRVKGERFEELGFGRCFTVPE